MKISSKKGRSLEIFLFDEDLAYFTAIARMHTNANLANPNLKELFSKIITRSIGDMYYAFSFLNWYLRFMDINDDYKFQNLEIEEFLKYFEEEIRELKIYKIFNPTLNSLESESEEICKIYDTISFLHFDFLTYKTEDLKEFFDLVGKDDQDLHKEYLCDISTTNPKHVSNAVKNELLEYLLLEEGDTLPSGSHLVKIEVDDRYQFQNCHFSLKNPILKSHFEKLVEICIKSNFQFDIEIRGLNARLRNKDYTNYIPTRSRDEKIINEVKELFYTIYNEVNETLNNNISDNLPSQLLEFYRDEEFSEIFDDISNDLENLKNSFINIINSEEVFEGMQYLPKNPVKEFAINLFLLKDSISDLRAELDQTYHIMDEDLTDKEKGLLKKFFSDLRKVEILLYKEEKIDIEIVRFIKTYVIKNLNMDID